MKFATRILCASATIHWAAVAWTGAAAADFLTSPAAQVLSFEAQLTNPAADVWQAESELFPSIVPNANADGLIIPSSYAAGCNCEGPTLGSAGCCCSSACGGCNCGSACGGCGCGDGCCGAGVVGGWATGAPLWTASAGAAILNRSQPVPAVLAAPLVGVAGIRATDFSIGTTVGLDLSIARRITERGSLEARYLGALEWDPRAEFTGLSNINLGGINIAGIQSIGGGYNSTLDSSEFNWRHQQSERFSWLVGFRWIELQDTVDFFVTTNVTSFGLNWNTNNHLYGGQIGGDYLFWESTSRPLSLKGSAKFGVYGNDADNDFSRFLGPIQIDNGGGADTEVAFVTDAALWVNYQINDRLSVRGGGQLLYIDGVALGSDQVAASLVQADPDVLDTSGYVFFSGGLVSLDYVW